MNLNELKSKSPEELNRVAAELGISSKSTQASELILAILRTHAKGGGQVTSAGTLEILSDGFGFLRASKTDFSPSPEDIYVSPSQIRRFHLSTGDEVSGQVRPPKESERYFALLRVESINGSSADRAKTPQAGPERSSIGVTTKLSLGGSLRAKLFDLLCPIALGQRCLIASPGHEDGSKLLADLAKGAKSADATIEIHLMSLSGRPERAKALQDLDIGQIWSTSVDDPIQKHAQIVDMVQEQLRRDTEKRVLLLVDDLAQVASTVSQCQPNAQSSLPGGLNSKGVHTCKKLFASGRNWEGKGSITVIGLVPESEDGRASYLLSELSPAANVFFRIERNSQSRKLALPVRAESYRNDDLETIVGAQDSEKLAKLHSRLEDGGWSEMAALEKELESAKDASSYLKSQS